MKGLQIEYEVLEVLEHLGPPARATQDRLFTGTDEDEEL